jgi:2-pyrone-4,6-dicarboxylate lactonase
MKVGSAVPEPCLPPLSPRPPRHLHVPPGAWDTHTHVIGAPPGYPWVSPRNYDPPVAGVDSYLAHLDALGLAYGVLVQISVHGTDNRLLVEALRACPQRLRGVAVVAPDTSGTELAMLDTAGVRGVRVVTLVAGGVGLETLRPLAERIAPLGWHIQLATEGDRLPSLVPLLHDLPVPLVLDHFGGCDPSQGVDGAGFRALLQLVERGAWVKLSGAYRLAPPPWDAITPLARRLIAAAPGQMVWASDWPHVALSDPAQMPSTEATLDLLACWTADTAVQHRILVSNPARLYGLPGAATAP